MLRDRGRSSLPKSISVRSTRSKIAPFLLGLSVSTGVIYALTIGNTPVYVGYFVAALLLVALLIRNSKLVISAVSAIDSSILVFFGIAALSISFSLAYCMAGLLSLDAPIMVVKGLFILAAGIAIYVAGVTQRKNSGAIFCGVAVGIVANAVISFAAQMAYDSGSVLSLISFFPQDSFVVPLKWGTPEPVGSHAIYVFRAQGLFLEASHLMVFLVTWGVLCIANLRSILMRALVLVCVCYMAAEALSPNIAVLILEVALALLFSRAGKLKKRQRTTDKVIPYSTIIAFLVLMFIGSLVLISFGSAISDAASAAMESLTDLNPFTSTDTGTTERFDSMMSALSALPNYPLGSGWNTESLALMSCSNGTVYASHSFALRLLIELGPLGLATYCWVIFRHTKGAFQSSKHGRFVAAAIVCMAIAQFMNGITLLPYVWLILGVARGFELDRQEAFEAKVSTKRKSLGEKDLERSC